MDATKPTAKTAARKRGTPAPLREFLRPYPPDVVALFLATRRAVLSAAPRANELIYDAYNAVSCAYSFTDRLREAFCHVAAYPRYVNLGFNRGAELPDPARLLVGSGASIRHVRIAGAADLERAPVKRLVRAAVAQGRALAPGHRGTGESIVKPVYPKKRRPSPPSGRLPREPRSKGPPAGARRKRSRRAPRSARR